ncbi:MAG: ABC transporter permease, partial [Blastocatellia bacterium]|nr:ABC transporter permease [Blastocatellia bacterium]
MPDWTEHVRRRLAGLRLSPTREAEIVEELSQHLEDRYRELLASGMSPDEATRVALADFRDGNHLAEYIAPLRQAHTPSEITPGAPGGRLFSDLWQDLRYAARTLRERPGFTVAVVLTLALGLGANAAIFSFVNAVLLKPLPYPDPERIVSVWEKRPDGLSNYITTLNFLDWERQNHCFQFLSAVTGDMVTLTDSGSPEQLYVQRVSASYFKALGVEATMGRTFDASENEVGNDLEVVLSNRIWQSRFGGDPQVIGRKITLDAKSYTIIGVLPANSTFGRMQAVMWLPLAFTPANMTRDYHWLFAIARLGPGVTLKQARDEMDTIGARIAALYPESKKGWGVKVDPYIDEVVQPGLRRSLWVLLAAVGAVLLIGCANVANLSLARGTDREHEIVIRSALGASRLRLIRQLLTESIFLGILGCVAGLALGNALMRGMKLWLPPDQLPPQVNVRMDYGVLLFTMVIGILTGILFGLAPALSGTRPDLAGSLKESGRTTARRTSQRMRTALVVAEVALSFVLLVGAGLLIRSFNKLASINLGVDTTNVLAMELPIPRTEFTNSATLTNYLMEVTQTVRSVPEVRDV